jgi:chitodextrinase
MVGNAKGYIVKYSTTGAISGSNWNLATNYTQSWTPLPGGSPETHVISGLSPDTKYWFAIEAFDAVPNYSNVSNSPSGRTLDLIPPTAITDLTASTPTASSITLSWTAPGDDGMSGNASGYVIRYSTAGPITSANWASATTYAQSWIPAKNGTEEIHVVSGLAPGTTYWFAVEAYDKAGNYGAISTISPSATTLASITPLGGIRINASNVDAILFLAVMVAFVAGGLVVYRRRWKRRWAAAKSQGSFEDL